MKAVIIPVILTIAMIFQGNGQSAPNTAQSSGKTMEIAMITDIGEVDDKSYNQGTWEGIVSYCEPRDQISYGYIKPIEQSTAEYLNAVNVAVDYGAQVVVTPGYLFEGTVYHAQNQYPDVKFILLDGYPNNEDYNNLEYKINENTVGVYYAEQEAGFLAGYTAVASGFTQHGFMGGEMVPFVMRYGYGFVLGANCAAEERGIKIDINYHYTGSFDATPAVQALAEGWYSDGTEVVFVCGGGGGASVVNAAEKHNRYVIGADIDQSRESPSVIYSAVKGLSNSVVYLLDEYEKGTFPGGSNLVLGAEGNFVGLTFAPGYTNPNFGEAEYNAIFDRLAKGEFDHLLGGLELAECSIEEIGAIATHTSLREIIVPQLSHADVTIRVGESFYLRVENISEIIWHCDDPTVATVDDTGKVQAMAKGTTKIWATGEDGSKDYCIVRVREYIHNF